MPILSARSVGALLGALVISGSAFSSESSPRFNRRACLALLGGTAATWLGEKLLRPSLPSADYVTEFGRRPLSLKKAGDLASLPDLSTRYDRLQSEGIVLLSADPDAPTQVGYLDGRPLSGQDRQGVLLLFAEQSLGLARYFKNDAAPSDALGERHPRPFEGRPFLVVHTKRDITIAALTRAYLHHLYTLAPVPAAIGFMQLSPTEIRARVNHYTTAMNAEKIAPGGWDLKDRAVIQEHMGYIEMALAASQYTLQSQITRTIENLDTELALYEVLKGTKNELSAEALGESLVVGWKSLEEAKNSLGLHNPLVHAFPEERPSLSSRAEGQLIELWQWCQTVDALTAALGRYLAQHPDLKSALKRRLPHLPARRRARPRPSHWFA